jgi:hypothetical protein
LAQNLLDELAGIWDNLSKGTQDERRDVMRRQKASCMVVEVVENEEGQPEHQELLPWADPYIARLLAKHRLESALCDSLSYLRDSASAEPPQGPHRFGTE